ncbi:MAG: hypothetical protein HY908_35350 [Myxococcales bacterium]|nr:hypothetical protein [Myxococcales bacterium]
MTLRVEPVTTAVAATRAEAPATPKQLLDAAGEFEAVLVAQMLRSAGVAQSCSEQTYRGMILDAMAAGVSEAGGLGLARQLAAMLSPPRGAQVGDKGSVHRG